MSVQALSLAFSVTGVTSAEKFLLVTLANYSDPKMICWPSHATLARDTNMTRRTIITNMAALERKGLIKRKHRMAGKGRTSDLIMLVLPSETISPPPSADFTTPVKPFHRPSETISHEPTTEPSIEPLARGRAQGSQIDLGKEMALLAKQLGSRKCLSGK